MAFINNDILFHMGEGYVRAIAMRFFRGFIPLNGENGKWQEAINYAVNATNNTNITSLDDWPEDAMRGEPIIGLVFEPEFEECQRGVSETPFFSTMLEVSKLI